ncbi:hypothetical protein IEQ34_016272 [Dendrobium chrysotoxum]|uniref:uracil phosphoribosyltransferase n=1 Tax=Dendrobium chrysotoxum TaxID=161865 RepID=A0AAV7GEZ9_DENCH|nr:hypothetical protein IEQ34_016272 [Dendrobium chrysotoxum]
MAAHTAIKTAPHRPPDALRSSPVISHEYLRCFRPSPLRLPLSLYAHSSSSSKIAAVRPRFGACATRSGTAMENKAMSDDRMLVLTQSGWMQVMVPPHPLIKHWISVLRNEQTPCAIFRSAMAELGRLLIYEASRDWLREMGRPTDMIACGWTDLGMDESAAGSMHNFVLCFSFPVVVILEPTISGEIQSPMGVATVEFIDPREPVMIVPILRAGLALAEHASSVLPATKTYHLGMRRDETTLQPSIYLNNLPDKFPEGSRVLVVDPMLATGGTIVKAIDLLKDRGLNNKQIKIISAIASPPALQKLSTKFPGIHVYTGMIDPVVNEHGFIIPGLGDAGDRCFGT